MTNWRTPAATLWSMVALGSGIHAKTFSSSSSSISTFGPIRQFQDLSNYQASHSTIGTLPPFTKVVFQYRGGQRWNDGDGNDDNDNYDEMDDDIGNEYDEEENDEEEEEDKMLDKNRNRPTADRYDHSMIDPPSTRTRPSKPTMLPKQQRSHSNTRPNKNGNQSPNPSPRRRRPKHWTQRIASQGFKVGSQLAWGAVQQTGNVAYQLIKPRHVDAAELLGLWRLDQQIVSKGVDLASVATIEMDPRQRLVTLKLPNGKTITEPYTFQKTRLGSFQTEFVIPAFLVGDTPRLYGYRGTWQRKLADQRVIKLVGKIYQVKQQRFGKSKGKYTLSQPIGTFVARRRMKLIEDDDDDDDDEEEEFSGNNRRDPDEQHNDYDDQEYDSE